MSLIVFYIYKKRLSIEKKKDTGKERSFGYIQYPSISLNGLQISLLDEALVKLYQITAPIETLYFDASVPFMSCIPSIKNKDRHYS